MCQVLVFFKKIILFIFGTAGSSLPHRFFLSCGEWGYSLVVVRGLLIVVASLVVEHGLLGAWASVVMAPQL